MPMTALPAAPSTSSPSDFAAKADALLAALPGFVTEANALETAVDADKTAAAGSASAASGSASTATTQASNASASAAAAAASAAAAAASAAAAAGSASTSAGWSATSTTSMALTAGAKTLTIQTGKQFTPGTNIKVKRTSDPAASHAFTTVTTYDSGTGALAFTLATDDIVGSGTYTDWTLTLATPRGATGATGSVPSAITADIVANAIEIATLKGSSTGLSSGVADAFEDSTGVDASGSTNETYDSTNDLYSNVGSVESSESLPAMTSNSAPAGYTSSSSNSSADAWKAFDHNTAVYFGLNVGVPLWVRRDLPAAIVAHSYKLTGSTIYGPAAFKLQGSNDGSAWTDLDSQSGITWGSTETKTFAISSPASYSKYRVYVTTEGGGAGTRIEEVALLQRPPQAMSLRSVAYTALSAPAEAMITTAADLNGGAINTDLIAYASRDNGTTWTAITLTAGRALADGTTIYSGTASIAAQPSGTNMKWRVDTTATYGVDVSAVVLQWS